MPDRQRAPHRPSITLSDIYYMLFRQKWKIVLLACVGVLGGVALHLWMPPHYQSEGKLFIRYVLDSTVPSPAPDAGGRGSDLRKPDSRGENIINAELEILTSFDLAQQVAEAFGPEKLLAKAGGGKDPDKAAVLINKNLIVEAPKNSSVIRLAFTHPDAALVQPVLRTVIASYYKKHAEVHRPVGALDELLTAETDQLRSRLAQTEQQLRLAKSKAGVISIEDSKKAFTDQLARIRQELFDTEAELAVRRTTLLEIGGSLNAKPPVSATNTSVEISEPPAAAVEEYHSVGQQLEILGKRRQELKMQFTDQHPLVKEVLAQVAAAEETRRKLLTDHPGLINSKTARPLQSPTDGGSNPAMIMETTRVAIVALESKLKVLTAQLERIRAEVGLVDAAEGSIVELQRKKDLEEANYRYFSSSLEQSRIGDALGANKVSNISVVQSPSPPFRDSVKHYQRVAGLVAGGLALGLVWAFLIEFFFDRSVRRPNVFETEFRLPLFLSIPHVKMPRPAEIGGSAPRLLTAPTSPAEAGTASSAMAKSALSPKDLWSRNPALNPYYEALRDRILLDFDIRNLTHVPKLVAVTSCDKGSGVTTVALGLAASLSETGGGNVLLVDMNREKAAAQQFYKGQTVCGLDEALEAKDHAQVNQNLYVVTESPGSDNGPRLVPKRFSSLLPKLRASDYDYIIFDLPPVSPTSVTPRVAGFMDQVLLVVESEKTDRDIVQKANALLAESKASVSAVLNKTRAYVPRQLNTDLHGNT
jgi:uncharacterized protein involved in exopolysaccharide biosynthesis/Mrp family chromosome partitioning ATPase